MWKQDALTSIAGECVGSAGIGLTVIHAKTAKTMPYILPGEGGLKNDAVLVLSEFANT